MARHGNEIFRAERGGLLEDAAADFGQCKTIMRWIEAVETPCGLHGLKGDTAHAGLLQRVFDDAAEFAIIHPFFHCDDECGGDAEAVEAFEGLRSHLPQVSTAEVDQW